MGTYCPDLQSQEPFLIVWQNLLHRNFLRNRRLGVAVKVERIIMPPRLHFVYYGQGSPGRRQRASLGGISTKGACRAPVASWGHLGVFGRFRRAVSGACKRESWRFRLCGVRLCAALEGARFLRRASPPPHSGGYIVYCQIVARLHAPALSAFRRGRVGKCIFPFGSISLFRKGVDNAL